MSAVRFNHVSISAEDLEESARFYEELFGLERLPAPDFPDTVVVWLRLGEQQLHLFRRGSGAPRFHHFAIDVDDFERVYLAARGRGLLDEATFRPALRELPDGSARMYVRDPAGNLDVTRGERRAILGPNGAGKTTLFNLVAGDFPPTSLSTDSASRTTSTPPSSARDFW